jgi:hypothetical protein
MINYLLPRDLARRICDSLIAHGFENDKNAEKIIRAQESDIRASIAEAILEERKACTALVRRIEDKWRNAEGFSAKVSAAAIIANEIETREP